MTSWSTVEHWETTLRLAINGCCVVSDRMLISMLFVSVEGCGCTVSPLGFEPSLSHFHRQVTADDEPLQQAFLPGLVHQVLIGLAVELLMTLTKSTIASSSESV